MGQNSSSSKQAHMETAQKTGALVLSNKKLTEVPDLASVERNLRSLDLAGNKLGMLPSSISNVKTLRHLNADNNCLASLSEEIGFLGKLESISAMYNNITCIPETFSELRNLKSLVLSHNMLSEFPVSICALPHLNLLDASFNQITEIPDQAGDLQAFEINLNNNKIETISPEIHRCPYLKTLRLSDNELELSAIPQELLVDSQVSLLCVENNHFNMKEFENARGYDEYMERYTAAKKKMY